METNTLLVMSVVACRALDVHYYPLCREKLHKAEESVQKLQQRFTEVCEISQFDSTLEEVNDRIAELQE